MWRFVLLVLIGCVCANLRNAIEVAKRSKKPAPKYVESLEGLNASTKALVHLLPPNNLQVTDPRRHYVIIIGVLACVVEYLNSDCTPPDYEREYLPAVDRLLPVIWEHPEYASDKLKSFLSDVATMVDVIKQLKDHNCQNLPADVCNRVLDVFLEGNKEYEDASQLLLTVGELSEMFKNETFEEEAKNYNEIPLLIHGKAKFKPIIMKATYVYNKLYGVLCHP